MWLAAAIGVATIYDMYSSNETAQEQARVAEQQAAAKMMQADEYWKRASSKAEDFLAQGKGQISNISEMYAASNVQGGSAIDAISGGWQVIMDSFYDQLDDAAYNARMMRLGANIDLSQADAYRTAGNMQMGGILLSGVAGGISAYNKGRG
jgi:hypothetical protein